jgi:hypothetical protein
MYATLAIQLQQKLRDGKASQHTNITSTTGKRQQSINNTQHIPI